MGQIISVVFLIIGIILFFLKMKINKPTSLPLDKFIEFALYDKDIWLLHEKKSFWKRWRFYYRSKYYKTFFRNNCNLDNNLLEKFGSPKKFNIGIGAGNGEMMKVIITTLKKFSRMFE